MSEENVEIARQIYQPFGPGSIDLAAIFADPDTLVAVRETFEPFVHPDVETLPDSRYRMMLGGEVGREERVAVHGLDGFMDLWQEWLSAWDRWTVTPVDFIDVDEARVLVMVDINARSKTHQVDVPVSGANLLTFSDNRLARVEIFLDRSLALQAAGLSE